MSEFSPTILAFCCNWCSYAGADLAGVVIAFPGEDHAGLDLRTARQIVWVELCSTVPAGNHLDSSR